ncbi:MAG: DNA-binding response OmpR family regulator [Gammaproteobacteria bacterium]|jgi:DNA-binding response OmpR family regulator
MFLMSAPKKVLVIDDDPSLQRQLRFCLVKRNKLGEVKDAFSRGADGYLIKPFELIELGSKVREMLV